MAEVKETVEGQEQLLTGADPNLEADSDDAEQEEPKGGDLKGALAQERGKRKEATKRAKDLEAELAKTRPLAQEYEQLLPYLPYLLKNVGGDGNGKQTQQQVQEDSEAAEFARVMGYEDDERMTAVERARAAIDFIDRRTGAKVQKEVGPARRVAAEARVDDIRQRAYNAKDKDGRLYAKRESIDRVFSQIPPEALMDPNNAVAALIMARGLGGPGDEPQDEPLHIERGGRAPRKQTELSDMGKTLAQIRGRSEKDWQKLHDEPEATGWDLE